MGKHHDIVFPGENADYRTARDELLAAELELDERIQKLAELRRKLPPGGLLKEDYVFDELVDGAVKSVKMSDLFAPDKDTLFVYSYMNGPNMEKPCPACTSLLDGFDGVAHHLVDRINFAVVAKNPIRRVREWTDARGWKRLRLLSSEKNSYNRDYRGENAEGVQIPAVNVFRREGAEIRHFYAAEMLFVKRPGHPRHADMMWPIWNVLDLTPEGRGTDWFPKLTY